MKGVNEAIITPGSSETSGSLRVLFHSCSWFGFYLCMFSFCLWMLRLRYCQSENTFLQQAHQRRHRRGGGGVGGRSDAQQEVGESSYFTKGVVSSRDLGVGINVLQIPGEGFAVQGVAEAFAGGNVPVVHPHDTCRQDPDTVLTVKQPHSFSFNARLI